MFLQTEENVWDKIFEINVKCSWLLAKEAYPELMKRGGGNIVFVSSIAAYNPMQVIYVYKYDQYNKYDINMTQLEKKLPT